MSDMLAPILYVVDNEVDAFWCFAGLMEQMVSTYWSTGQQWNFIMACNVLQMQIFDLSQDHTKERIKKLRTLVVLVCPNLYHFLGNVLACSYMYALVRLFQNSVTVWKSIPYS